MPQMSPMWWTSIMIYTILIMYMSMNIIFYIYKSNMKMKKKNNKKIMNWKW